MIRILIEIPASQVPDKQGNYLTCLKNEHGILVWRKTYFTDKWKLKYGRKENCEVVSWYKSAHVDAEQLKPLLNIEL